MKTLSLTQPRIMMVVGLPGAGKSTFAEAFAETFGISRISFDRLRAELFSAPQFNDTENEIINRLQQYMMDELVKNKRSLLLDGGCNTRAERQKIEQFAKNHGYDTLVIWVQTNPETAKGRATGRIRKPADTYQPIATDVFERLTKKFAQPRTEEYVVISGMHTYNTQVRMVLRKLTAQRAADTAVASPKRSTTPPQRSNIVVR